MKNTLLSILRIMIIVLLFGGGIKYSTTLHKYKEVIDKTFNASLKLDLSKRIEASSEIKHKKGIMPISPKDTLVGKGILIQTSQDTTFYPYKNEKDRLLMKVDEINMLQTATHYYNPIHPIQLDSIFLSLLGNEGWKVQVGILYSDSIKQSHQHTNTDMSIYLSSFHTEIIPLGLNNEMTVQAFVRFHPHWIFQKGGRVMLGIIILWVALCGVLLFVWIRQRRKTNPGPVLLEKVSRNEDIKDELVPQPSDVSPEKETVKKEIDNKVAIGEYIYDKEKGFLYWKDKQTEYLKKRQENTILMCLLKAPGHSCKESELLNALGKKTDKSYTNSLQSIISRLRKCFEKDPHVQILHTDEGEYQLITDAPAVPPKKSVTSSTDKAVSPDSSME